MKVIVQRAKMAKCIINNDIISSIDKGYMILVGFTHTDTHENIEKMCKKIINLRIFEDENQKMNLDIKRVNGSILSISQFTLYANTKDGNRPSFVDAMNPIDAIKLYDDFNITLRGYGINVATGVFGEDMKIDFINDGPVTIILEN